MKIVVLDGYTLNPGDLSWSGMEALGEFSLYERTSAEDIVSRIGDAEIVITNKTPITKETFDACPSIKYIGVLATGYNVVDFEYAKSKKIPVTNVPIYGTNSVAQFVFAHLLTICHHVSHHADTVRNGKWSDSEDFCYWDYPLIELAGKTMGIIGLGRIGYTTAKIAIGFGMKVLAFDERPNKDLEAEDITFVELDQLLAGSDVISLHCPLFPSTEKIINDDTIAKMKDGVIIINTSRGPLIDQEALKRGLESKKIYSAGIDVVDVEPISEDNILIPVENCNITPHIAWAPIEARSRLMNVAVDNVEAFINNTPINVVN